MGRLAPGLLKLARVDAEAWQRSQLMLYPSRFGRVEAEAARELTLLTKLEEDN
jgi:hypothetical protein